MTPATVAGRMRTSLLRTRSSIDFGLVLLALFAFGWCWLCGERGFAPFRQSFLFDGGFRVLSGQVPFRDFIAPYGPVPFWLQAGFFGVFGVSSFAYLLAAALGNVVATLLVVAIVRLLLAGQKSAAYVAGLLTATWFYPPSGTPGIDQTAFLFALVAIACVVLAIKRSASPARTLLVVAGGGIATALVLLTRSSSGLLTLATCLVLLPLGSRDLAVGPGKRVVGFLGGLAATLGLFVVWLVTVSDPGVFAHRYLGLPLEAAAGWLASGWLDWFAAFLVGAGPLPVRLALVAAGACALLVTALLLFGTLTGAKPEPQAWPPCVLAVALAVFQYTIIVLSNERVENAMPFLGLVLVLGARSLELALIISRSTMAGLRFVMTITLMLVLATGLWTSWTRQVHQIFADSSFPAHSAIPAFGALRWGDPTRFTQAEEFDERDVHSLVNELRQADKPFFVFPDFTFLYGLVGKPSLQPLLWFEPAVTYPVGGDPELDRWIIRMLEQQEVQIVIFESDSDARLGTVRRLADFPALRAWLTEHFGPDSAVEIGSFWVWLKKSE